MTSISVKVTVPKQIFDQQAMVNQLNRLLRNKTGPEIKKLFYEATSTWGPPPNYSIVPFERNSAVGVSVHTFDKRMALVNAGAKPHIIRAKRNVLSFQTGYRAKSRPGSLRSSAGGKSGPYISLPFILHHPGFEARKFDEAIQEQYQSTFEKDVQDTIEQVARASKS